MKKQLLLIILIVWLSGVLSAQVSISDDGSMPDNSAMLDVKSNDKGFLPPRMTTAQRDAIGSPADFLVLINTDLGCMQVYHNSQWNNVWCYQCAPLIILNPLAQAVCEGDVAEFSINASGQSITSQWQESTDSGTSWSDITNEGAYSGATSNSLSIISTAAMDTYQYRCVVSGACLPDAVSNEVVLTVSAVPAISSQPTAQSISVGDNTSFSVTATGSGLTYQWQESTDGGSSWSALTNGGVYSDVTTSTMNITSATAGMDTYRYRCVVSGVCSPVATSNTAELTVNETVLACGTGTTVADVYSSATGRIWMDRNLGASRVATSSTDYKAYGALFQWGRAADGHECMFRVNSTSGTPVNGTTTTNSSTDDPGHNLFITEDTSPYDWRTPQNNNLWQGVSGTNNPCPSGYRIPTSSELKSERYSWVSNNAAGAFASPLKLPLPGIRNGGTGLVNGMGSNVYYWSSTDDLSTAIYTYALYFDSADAQEYLFRRSNGFSVRCIKD